MRVGMSDHLAPVRVSCEYLPRRRARDFPLFIIEITDGQGKVEVWFRDFDHFRDNFLAPLIKAAAELPPAKGGRGEEDVLPPVYRPKKEAV